MRHGGLAPVLYRIYPLLIYSWRPSQSPRRLLIILVDSIRYQARLSAIYVVHESVFSPTIKTPPSRLPIIRPCSRISGLSGRSPPSYQVKSTVGRPPFSGNRKCILEAIGKVSMPSPKRLELAVISLVNQDQEPSRDDQLCGLPYHPQLRSQNQPTAPVKPMVSVL